MGMLGKRLAESMNAKIIGSGEEVAVLAHGYGGDQSVWEKILPYLGQRFRVLVFDWSFSGAIIDPNLFDAMKYRSFEAFADDLIALLDELNLKSATFFGHSMSGMIGCIASIKRPDLFERLVLVCASPRYLNSEDYEGGFKNSDIENIFMSIESDYENWASNFASLVVDASDPSSKEKFEKCLRRMKPEIALSVAKIVFLSDERATLEKVMIPCTIIHTSSDIVVPDSVPEYMQDKIKGKSTVEIVQTDGHFPQLTAHLEFLNVIDKVFGC